MEEDILPAPKSGDEIAITDAQASDFLYFYAETRDVLLSVARAQIKDPRYSSQVVADRVLRHSKIAPLMEAVKRLPQKAPEELNISREFLAEQVMQLHSAAKSENDYRVALACLKFLGELHGLMEHKVAITHRAEIKDLPTSELRALLHRRKTVEEAVDADFVALPVPESN